MNVRGELSNLSRLQSTAAVIAVWGVATAVTGWLMNDYFSAALGTATGVGVFGLFYSATEDQDFDNLDGALRWLVDVRRPTRRDFAVVAVVLAIGLASRLTFGTVHSLVFPAAERGVHRSVETPDPSLGYIALLVVGAVVLGPIFEELVFRNGLQKLLAGRTGWPAAIVVSSLLFALFHVPSYGGFGASLTALALPMVVVFTDSLLYGAAYWRTGNVVVAMAAHGLSNGIAVLSFAM